MSVSKIKLNLKKQEDRSYNILIGSNLISNINKYLEINNLSASWRNNIIIITDDKVKKLYANKLKINTKILSFKNGEQSKNYDTVIKLQDQMMCLGLGRDTLVIALGGGVVGDVAGFVAATYMRGLPFVQIPTTMLAMVDSSVGGKTGINTKYGKNLVGAFYQPKQVIIDVDVLKTLPKRHYINGLVEAKKIFLTNNKNALKLKNNLEIIKKAVLIKKQIVERDEKETGERMVLNFGHTIGHAIEKLENYNILHGEAVALGILVESKISEILGILSSDNCRKVEKLILDLNINKKLLDKYDAKQILEILKLDKKSENKIPRFVLLKSIGEVYKKDGKFVHEVDEKIILKALNI